MTLCFFSCLCFNTLTLLQNPFPFQKWKGLLPYLLISNIFHIKGGHLSTQQTESDRMCMCLCCVSVDVLHKHHLMIYCYVLSLLSVIGKLSLDKPSLIHVFTLLCMIFLHQYETKEIINSPIRLSSKTQYLPFMCIFYIVCIVVCMCAHIQHKLHTYTGSTVYWASFIFLFVFLLWDVF